MEKMSRKVKHKNATLLMDQPNITIHVGEYGKEHVKRRFMQTNLTVDFTAVYLFVAFPLIAALAGAV